MAALAAVGSSHSRPRISPTCSLFERRVWSQAEVTAFHNNPYQLWEPDAIAVYMPGGAIKTDGLAVATQSATLTTGVPLLANQQAVARSGAQLAREGVQQNQPFIV